MICNIPLDSQNFFALRAAEKERQRMEQIQARRNNQNFVRDPALSGLPRPRVVSSFARR